MNTATNQLTSRFLELEHFVGHTPMIEIKGLFNKPGVKIYAKMEWQQFGGSVKARPAYHIIKDALETGKLKTGQSLLDATSGNTGLAYAIFCAVSGIDLTLCVPGNASRERKQALETLGVNVVYTDPFGTTDVAQEVAREMVAKDPERYYYADQYSNDNNWKAHYKTTAQEIWYETHNQVSHFVAGLGTTGTFTGTGRRLKELNPDIELIGLQPETALHGLEGWKHLETAKIPAFYDDQLADRQLTISTEGAYNMLKDAARHEGLLLSPSSAANLLGAISVADQIDEGVIVTVLPDDASKYSEVLDQIFKN